MGAVISLIADVFQAIGIFLLTVVNAIGTLLMWIIEGVVTVIEIIISVLTCGAYTWRGRGVFGSGPGFGGGMRFRSGLW